MSEIIIFSPSPSLFGFCALTMLPKALTRIQRFQMCANHQLFSNCEKWHPSEVFDLLKGSIEFEIFGGDSAEPQRSDMDKQKDNFWSDLDALLSPLISMKGGIYEPERMEFRLSRIQLSPVFVNRLLQTVIVNMGIIGYLKAVKDVVYLKDPLKNYHLIGLRVFYVDDFVN